jgi:hypothetical protein
LKNNSYVTGLGPVKSKMQYLTIRWKNEKRKAY